MSHFQKITAVIVLYNTTELVLECLKKIKNINIIIVDNGKNDPELIKIIKKNYNIVKYFRPKKNLGFGRACNFAFKYIKSQYTLLIEPDVFIEESSLQNLISTLDRYPNAGMVTPRFLDNDHNTADCLNDFPERGKGIERNKLEEIVSYKLSKSIPIGDTCINFCLAAIVLLNNKIIKNVGLFNKKIFLFWEDFELCRKLFENKIPIIKSYNSTAVHLGEQSVKSSIVNKFIINLHHSRSAYIYFKVNKNNFLFIKRTFLYLFRFISYLLILNVNKSLKNLARLLAIYMYLKK